jgi:LacI family transcriptional regulator
MDQTAARKRATIEDIVKLSGVSRSSVFRYLSGKTLRPALSSAIETAMRRLGYPVTSQPDSRAFELSISTSPAFGGFRGYAEVVEGIIARAVEKGVHVTLNHGLGFEEIKGNPPAYPAERRGVVIIGKSMAEEEAEARELSAQGLPFLFVNRVLDEAGYSYVSADFREAAMQATVHLLDLGRRRVAMWDDGSEQSRVQRDKKRGFFAAFGAAGLEPQPELLCSKIDGSIEAEATRILSAANPPDAWFAMDDRAAMRVIRVAHDLGISVPEDLAVIGMNDIEVASLSRPSVSSVRIPFFEAGWSAVDVLGRLIERPVEASIRILLSHRLIARESSLGRESSP